MRDSNSSDQMPFEVEGREWASARPLGAILLLLLGYAALLFRFGWAEFSGSIDIAWHYTLQRYFEDGFQLGEWSSRALGPMLDYPPLAHSSAALIAIWVAVPSLVAMNWVAVTGVFVTYVGAVYLVPKGHRVLAGLIAAVVFLVINISGYRTFSGSELFGNFFFAQVVGDGLLVAAAAGVAHFRTRVNLAIVAPVAALLVGSFFNLSAVKFTIFLGVLQLIAFVAESNRSTASFFRSLFPVVLAGIATVLQPNFFGMVSNSGHDGGTTLTMPVLGLTAIGAFFSGVLLIVLKLWRGDEGSFNFPLGSFSIALALAMALQAMAFFIFGLGSPYAVAKHGALAGTVGVFAFASFVSQQYRALPREFVASALLPAYFTFQALSPAGGSILQSVLYMHDLRSFAEKHPEIIDNSVSYTSDVSAQTNFAAALGELGMGGWTPESYEQLGRFKIVPEFEELADFAIVSPGQVGVMDPSCLIAEGQVSRLVRAQCLPDD